MSNWYQNIQKESGFILNEIKKHPFIIQLMDGTLPKDVFQFYIHQDALYLAEYKKILAIVATKCSEISHTQFFLESSTGIIYVENELHQMYLKEDIVTNQASPTCLLYTSYLHKMIGNNSIEEALAAILPCFTIYKKIGDYILANQTNKTDNPYQNWIDTYGGEEFGIAVEKAIKITNSYTQNAKESTLKNMNIAFEKASKLEWMFWDSAYNKEQWKV